MDVSSLSVVTLEDHPGLLRDPAPRLHFDQINQEAGGRPSQHPEVLLSGESLSEQCCLLISKFFPSTSVDVMVPSTL